MGQKHLEAPPLGYWGTSQVGLLDAQYMAHTSVLQLVYAHGGPVLAHEIPSRRGSHGLIGI